MAEPFERANGDGGLLGRLVGARKQTTAIRAIEDRLARARRLRDVSAHEVTEMAARHGVDLGRRLRTPRRNLYRRFLEHCLLDQALSAEEVEDLAHLRRILRLHELDAVRVHEEVASRVYGEAIDQVLEDQELDPEEAEFLRTLRNQLELPEGMAERIYLEGQQRAKQRYLSMTVARESSLFAPRETVLQLAGASEKALEDAVQAAVEEASRAVPQLRWIELAEIRAEVEQGRVARWHVRLKGGLEGEG